MRSGDCVEFLKWALPQLRLRWPGFRKVHGQVCKRLGRRLKQLGLASLDEYRSRLEKDAGEWARLDDLCHITISRFYRDRHVFDHLGARILPELGRIAAAEHRPVACWCEIVPPGQPEGVINTLYIRKSALNGTIPTQITVQIET